MSLATRIYQARLASGISQEALARTIGVATVTPSRWERGKHRPLPQQLPAIAAALDVSIEWLLEDEPVAVPSVAGGPFESAFRAWLLGTLDERIKIAVKDALVALGDRRRLQVPVTEYRRKRDPRPESQLVDVVST